VGAGQVSVYFLYRLGSGAWMNGTAGIFDLPAT
jgi:hypothetical protein